MARATVRVIGGPTLAIETGGPRLPTDPTVDQPGPFDAVLLSHTQHGDDPDLLERVPLVLTTPDAAERLGGSARALPPWYHLSLPRFDGVALRITGVPAQEGLHVTTHTGFVLSSVDTPAVYVSADNACLDVVQQVAQICAPIGIAVLFVDGSLTLTSDQAARAAAILASPTVIPAHVKGWDHDTECVNDVRAAFARHGLSDRLRILTAGDTATV
jgi:L-ascorbate metabolism protein UlaG (beta-lactamase superfamily)